MISEDGWLDWAERVPGPPHKVYEVTNAAIGYVPHSAVGFYPGWASRLFGPDRASVHGWIAYDGRVIQHYPFTASCWASGSRYPNTNFIAFENEGGPPGNESEPLRDPQIEANARIILELAQWRGWQGFRRPTGPNDQEANLYEHRECARFGSEPTACPSSRVPWDAILSRLSAQPPGGGATQPPASRTVVVQLENGAQVALDIDEYAKGVVPNEMASGWPLEALKAQAVVAKSYALAKNAPVLTTTQDQVYRPDRRAPDTDAAVDAVKEIYAGLNGQVVMPFFFAHCSGQTRTPSQAGWSAVADRPFLQPVACPCGNTAYFGHGIGMCQEGARAMALQGATFDQILRHYYSGIELIGMAPPPPQFQIYVSQQDDTLLTIAARFGLEWGAIFQLNRDVLSDPNVVPPGCELKIPQALGQVVDETYEVQRGDTLFSLARRWGCNIEAIVALNGIADARVIRIGQILRRPRQEA